MFQRSGEPFTWIILGFYIVCVCVILFKLYIDHRLNKKRQTVNKNEKIIWSVSAAFIILFGIFIMIIERGIMNPQDYKYFNDTNYGVTSDGYMIKSASVWDLLAKLAKVFAKGSEEYKKGEEAIKKIDQAAKLRKAHAPIPEELRLTDDEIKILENDKINPNIRRTIPVDILPVLSEDAPITELFKRTRPGSGRVTVITEDLAKKIEAGEVTIKGGVLKRGNGIVGVKWDGADKNAGFVHGGTLYDTDGTIIKKIDEAAPSTFNPAESAPEIKTPEKAPAEPKPEILKKIAPKIQIPRLLRPLSPNASIGEIVAQNESGYAGLKISDAFAAKIESGDIIIHNGTLDRLNDGTPIIKWTSNQGRGIESNGFMYGLNGKKIGKAPTPTAKTEVKPEPEPVKPQEAPTATPVKQEPKRVDAFTQLRGYMDRGDYNYAGMDAKLVDEIRLDRERILKEVIDEKKNIPFGKNNFSERAAGTEIAREYLVYRDSAGMHVAFDINGNPIKANTPEAIRYKGRNPDAAYVQPPETSNPRTWQTLEEQRQAKLEEQQKALEEAKKSTEPESSHFEPAKSAPEVNSKPRLSPQEQRRQVDSIWDKLSNDTPLTPEDSKIIENNPELFSLSILLHNQRFPDNPLNQFGRSQKYKPSFFDKWFSSLDQSNPAGAIGKTKPAEEMGGVGSAVAESARPTRPVQNLDDIFDFEAPYGSGFRFFDQKPEPPKRPIVFPKLELGGSSGSSKATVGYYQTELQRAEAGLAQAKAAEEVSGWANPNEVAFWEEQRNFWRQKLDNAVKEHENIFDRVLGDPQDRYEAAEQRFLHTDDVGEQYDALEKMLDAKASGATTGAPSKPELGNADSLAENYFIRSGARAGEDRWADIMNQVEHDLPPEMPGPNTVNPKTVPGSPFMRPEYTGPTGGFSPVDILRKAVAKHKARSGAKVDKNGNIQITMSPAEAKDIFGHTPAQDTTLGIKSAVEDNFGNWVITLDSKVSADTLASAYSEIVNAGGKSFVDRATQRYNELVRKRAVAQMLGEDTKVSAIDAELERILPKGTDANGVPLIPEDIERFRKINGLLDLNSAGNLENFGGRFGREISKEQLDTLQDFFTPDELGDITIERILPTNLLQHEGSGRSARYIVTPKYINVKGQAAKPGEVAFTNKPRLQRAEDGSLRVHADSIVDRDLAFGNDTTEPILNRASDSNGWYTFVDENVPIGEHIPRASAAQPAGAGSNGPGFWATMGHSAAEHPFKTFWGTVGTAGAGVGIYEANEGAARFEQECKEEAARQFKMLYPDKPLDESSAEFKRLVDYTARKYGLLDPGAYANYVLPWRPTLYINKPISERAIEEEKAEVAAEKARLEEEEKKKEDEEPLLGDPWSFDKMLTNAKNWEKAHLGETFGNLPVSHTLTGAGLGAAAGGTVGAMRYLLGSTNNLSKEEKKRRRLMKMILSNASIGAGFGATMGGIADIRQPFVTPPEMRG